MLSLHVFPMSAWVLNRFSVFLQHGTMFRYPLLKIWCKMTSIVCWFLSALQSLLYSFLYDVSCVKHIHDGNPSGCLSFLTSLSPSSYEFNREIARGGWQRQIEWERVSRG